MKTLNVEQQVEALRPTLGLASKLHKWLLAAAVLGVVVAVVLWHPVPLMFSIFFGIVGLAETSAGPNIVAAVSAYNSGSASDGEVLITITCPDMDYRYHATVREPGHPDWVIEFIPQGWKPAEGQHQARIWRGRDQGAPLLAATGAGLLIPRYPPTPVV